MHVTLADPYLQTDGRNSALLSSLFVDIDVDSRGSVSALYKAWSLWGIGIVRSLTQGSSLRVRRSDQHIKFGSASNGIFLCFQLEGEVTLAQAERRCVLRPGEFALLDSRHEYEVNIFEGTESVWIKIPTTRIDARGLNSLDIVAKRRGSRDGVELITSEFIRSFVSQMEALQQPGNERLPSILVDLVSSSCIDHDMSGKNPGQSLARYRTWQRACAFIVDNISDETLCPSQIAGYVGVSVRYLNELFSENGVTPMQWILSRRLELCHKSLEEVSWTPGAIADIVYRFGFTNISSFNRAFREKYKSSPRNFMYNAKSR